MKNYNLQFKMNPTFRLLYSEELLDYAVTELTGFDSANLVRTAQAVRYNLPTELPAVDVRNLLSITIGKKDIMSDLLLEEVKTDCNYYEAESLKVVVMALEIAEEELNYLLNNN